METSYSQKPYFFVPLVGKADRHTALNRQKLLAENTRAGKLRITIECITPLHFGSGTLVFDESMGKFAHSLLRENGRIALPGSSFKGMLRSVFEAVTASCVLNAPRALLSKVGDLSACSDRSGLCPACSVFGRLMYKGKLIIGSFRTEAQPEKLSLPPLEQPFKTYPHPRKGERNPRTGNERLYYGKFSDIQGLDVARMSKADFLTKKEREKQSGGLFYGRKFYKHSGGWKSLTEGSGKEDYECLPVGALLTGEITYQGLTEDELGALLFALGLGWENPIFHKLGYAKPAFLGSVRLMVEPEPLWRYENNLMTDEDAERMAIQYYERHKPTLEAAVCALSREWSKIGTGGWVMQDGKYGY